MGISDLTRGLVLPKELDGLLAWIACIADAQPIESYTAYLEDPSLHVDCAETHDDSLLEMVHNIRMKLPDVDTPQALSQGERSFLMFLPKQPLQVLDDVFHHPNDKNERHATSKDIVFDVVENIRPPHYVFRRARVPGENKRKTALLESET